MDKEEKEQQPVKLFWTGGWDSTFRLMQLLFEEKKRVQPYYILSIGRKSTGMELETMGWIRDQLVKEHPSVRDQILPLIVASKDNIESCEEITNTWKKYRRRLKLGSQYDWMARYCKQEGISDMELCVERYEKPDHNWYFFEFLRKLHLAKSPDVENVDDPVLEDISKLFCYFRFPFLDTTRQMMLSKTKEKNWERIMYNTWFCYHPRHHPLKGRVPCGACVPCKNLYKHGFEWRIPLYSKIIRNTYQTKKKMIQMFKKIFSHAK